MTETQKRYDSKYKVTRIFLADYLLLKELTQRADVSMSEALHKIISQEISRAEPREVVTQILTPVTSARSTPATITRARLTPVASARLIPITTRARSTPVTIGFAREV